MVAVIGCILTPHSSVSRTLCIQQPQQIDYNDPQVRERILTGAIRRASKWISLSEAKQMAGQVGGVSVHKKPLLSLKPDYVLKPLLTDHRGIRELAFYEALHMASRGAPTANAYSVFLTGRPQKTTNVTHYVGEVVDTIAVALAMLLNDPVVTGCEAALRRAWKKVKREVDALYRLAKFTAPYYGLVGQARVAIQRPFGLSDDAHLLLLDLTNTFSKPCVMDLKMGTQSYEPDATTEKQSRESSKYPQQSTFGFRITGMRVFEPHHPDADDSGYVFFGKEYGRSLATRDDVMVALRTFFSAGNVLDDSGNSIGVENDGALSTTVRTRSLSKLILEVRSLRRWFDETETTLRFYASSLLIVYEGDMSSGPRQWFGCR